MALLRTVLVTVLAWGVLAFGAVYPWAYRPLLVGCAVVGVAGCCVGWRRRGFPVSLAAALLTVGMAVGAQLVPLPADVLARVSPSTDAVLRRYDVVYAFDTAADAQTMPRDGETARHPLSIDPAGSRRALLFFATLALLFVGTTAALSSGRLEPSGLVRGIVVVAALVAIIGIVQRASSDVLIYGFWQPEYRGAIFGPFVNRNHFAGWMMMATPLAIASLCATVDHDRRSRWTMWQWLASPEANQVVLVTLAIVLMAAATLLTGSRSGIVGVTAGFIALGALASRAIGGDPGIRRRVLAASLFALPLPVAAWIGVGPALSRFADLDDAGITGRLALWHDTAHVIRDFLATGTGMNTYGVAMLFYKTTDPLHHYYAAHNDYLQVVSDGGLLVAVPVAVLVGLFVREVWRRFRAGHDSRATWWLRTGATTGIVAIALQAAVEYSLHIPANAVLFAVLCAIAVHLPAVPPRS